MSADVEETGLSPAEETETVEEPRRRRSRTLIAFLVISALALAAGGVFGGMVWHRHAVTAARQDAQDAGTREAIQLLSYDYRNLEQTMAQRMDLVTGQFQDRYRSMVQDQILPVARNQQVATTASVVASSVVGGDTDQVTLLLFLNQSSTAPSLQQPLLTGSRVEMTLENHDGRWLTADLKPV